MELRAYTDTDFALTEALETDPAVMHHLGGPRAREQLLRVHRLRLADPWWFVITEELGGPGVGTIGIWDAEHDGETITRRAGWCGPSVGPRDRRARRSRCWWRARGSSRGSPPSMPSIRSPNTPSNALCRKSGFALLGETDVEFAGHPLHCNHWALGLQTRCGSADGVALPGELDTGFDGNGRKAIGFGSIDAARAVLVQPDGRIAVLAGGGGPSPRFGGYAGWGTARLARRRLLRRTSRRTLGFGGEQEGAFAAAPLQADGRIVLAGDSDLGTTMATRAPGRRAGHCVLLRRQERC